MVVVTLLLMVILIVTGIFVWQSGILSGQVPLVEATSESVGTIQGVSAPGKEADSFIAKVFCVDPTTQLLVAEDRSVSGSPHTMGVVMNVLNALRSTPTHPNLQPAVPPEIQFRTAFLDRETRTIYIDLANLPETWSQEEPLQVALCLYAIVHTVSNLGSEFQYIHFLVDGREAETNPGGLLLSENFYPAEEWVGQVVRE
jgi:hypothetical protein